MYAIAQVIYGIPLHTNEYGQEEKWSEDLDAAIEDEQEGFLHYYSGHIHIPAAFGIELCKFDEACDHVDISSLKLEPTKEQWQQFESNMNTLPQSLQDEVNKYGLPHTFILWSTS